MDEKTDQELIDAVEDATEDLLEHQRETDEEAMERVSEALEVDGHSPKAFRPCNCGGPERDSGSRPAARSCHPSVRGPL